MIPVVSRNDPIRRKIETLSTQLNLPTVRRALGILEGEHPSGKIGGGYDYQGIRAYETGDEARLIDWHSSARMGRPMVVERERMVTSKSWLLMDAGVEMLASTPHGEVTATVASNALRLFAALCLRRSDEVSLVLADNKTISRIPCQGGFASFESTLDHALSQQFLHPRNIDALLGYAERIRDSNSLIVIATDETAIQNKHIGSIRKLAQTHPLILVSVATLNPLAPNNAIKHITDGYTGRRLPAFLRKPQLGLEVQTHRHYQNLALKRDLTRTGSQLMHVSSSESMLTEFTRTLSTAHLTSSKRQVRQLGTVQ